MSKTELFVDASGIWCMGAQPYGIAWADLHQVWGYTLNYPEIGPQLELELTTKHGANLIVNATWSGFDKALAAISKYLFLKNNDWQQRAKAVTANEAPYLIWSQNAQH